MPLYKLKNGEFVETSKSLLYLAYDDAPFDSDQHYAFYTPSTLARYCLKFVATTDKDLLERYTVKHVPPMSLVKYLE